MLQEAAMKQQAQVSFESSSPFWSNLCTSQADRLQCVKMLIQLFASVQLVCKCPVAGSDHQRHALAS